MEELVNKKFLAHRKRHWISRTLIFTFLVLNLTHPGGYAVAKENLIHQRNIDLPAGGNNKNDLTNDNIQNTMISNEAIVASINTADNNNNEDSLSSSVISANNTQRLRRDLRDDDDANDDNNSITKSRLRYVVKIVFIILKYSLNLNNHAQ